MAGKVGYMAVTVGGSKTFRRPTSNINLGPILVRSRSDLGPISARSRLDLAYAPHQPHPIRASHSQHPPKPNENAAARKARVATRKARGAASPPGRGTVDPSVCATPPIPTACDPGRST
eukprot:7290626-Prymnesium_polylepis.1